MKHSGQFGRAETDRVASAIASAPRRAMLERVAVRPATMSQLSEHLGVTLPAIDKHVRVLRDARLVTTNKAGRVVTVSLDPTGFEAVSGWIERTTEMWRERLANFTRYVETAESTTPSDTET